MARLAGIRWRYLLNQYAFVFRLVFNEQLKLIERPIIAVLCSIGFGLLALFGILADAAQVFHPDTGLLPFGQTYDAFAHDMVDMGNDTPFPVFQLFDCAMFTGFLQFLPAFGVDAPDMANPSQFEEHNRPIGSSDRSWYVLPSINAQPSAGVFRLWNFLGDGKARIPDTFAGLVEFNTACFGLAFDQRIQPSLMAGFMHFHRKAFFDPAHDTEQQRIGVSVLLKVPVLVVGFQRQALKVFNFGSSVGVADSLIHPCRTDFDMMETFGSEGFTLTLWHRNDGIGRFRVEGLQAQKLIAPVFVQAQEWQLQCLGCDVHDCYFNNLTEACKLV